MVIQRSWKGCNDSESSAGKNSTGTVTNLLTNSISSSDDSDGSIETNNSNADFGSSILKTESAIKKSSSTLQIAENVLFRLKQRFGWQTTGPNSSSEAVMRSLELLRINIQAAFDKEVDAVVKTFMETYFKPCFQNIKENIGDYIISDDVLQKMSCALLENCKTQYTTHRSKSSLVVPSSEATYQNRLALKRPEQKVLTSFDQPKRICSVPTPESGVNNKLQLKTSPCTEQQLRTSLQGHTAAAQPRRQIFWNTANISLSTNFVLDVQANQAFGFGTDGKERLASKHPELIRYLPDVQDRDWLVEQNIIPAQNRNSRFLFLIYEEVNKLYHSTEHYKNQSNINLSIMHKFRIPSFMIQKMKLFFVDLNIKSRGLIANSYSTAGAGNNNSHLRNALLQGSQITNGPASSTSNAVSTSTDTAVIRSENANQQKLKSSSLSSSHATLTALLTNSTNNPCTVAEGLSNSNFVAGIASSTTNAKGAQ